MDSDTMEYLMQQHIKKMQPKPRAPFGSMQVAYNYNGNFLELYVINNNRDKLKDLRTGKISPMCTPMSTHESYPATLLKSVKQLYEKDDIDTMSLSEMLIAHTTSIEDLVGEPFAPLVAEIKSRMPFTHQYDQAKIDILGKYRDKNLWSQMQGTFEDVQPTLYRIKADMLDRIRRAREAEFEFKEILRAKKAQEDANFQSLEF